VAPLTRKQALDPANCEFTLQHTIYLDRQRIAGTSKQYKLSYLTFPEVWQESIDKAGEVAERPRNTDKWGLENSLATISAARVKPITSDIDKRSDWFAVEQIIKSLYLDKKNPHSCQLGFLLFSTPSYSASCCNGRPTIVKSTP